MQKDADSCVGNLILGLIEETLHIIYRDWNEVQIGEKVNELAEEFLECEIPEEIKRQSLERRRKLVG